MVRSISVLSPTASSATPWSARRKSNCRVLRHGVERVPARPYPWWLSVPRRRARRRQLRRPRCRRRFPRRPICPAGPWGEARPASPLGPPRESVVVIASYPGAWIGRWRAIRPEFNRDHAVGSSAHTRSSPMTSVAPRNLLPRVSIGHSDRDFRAGPQHLGTAKVTRASTTGTAKSEMLTGHDTRLQSRSLFDGVVRSREGRRTRLGSASGATESNW